MPISTTGSGYVYGTRLVGADGGYGSVTIDGGIYSFDEVSAARYSSFGSIVLDGGADVTVEDQSGDPFAVFAAEVEIGRSFDGYSPSVGYLDVLGGSRLTIRTGLDETPEGYAGSGYQTLRIGFGDSGFGSALVSGAGSRIETAGGAPRLNVGFSGAYGALRIEQGGVVGTFDLGVGRNGGNGVVTIDGPGSRLVSSPAYGSYLSAFGDSSAFVDVGRSGLGILAIRNGGEFRAENVDGQTDGAFLRLGREYNGEGALLVTGPGSEVNLVQNGPYDAGFTGSRLIVGRAGYGYAEVVDSGAVNIVGDDARLFVGGSNVDDGLGREGSGMLVIGSGGRVSLDPAGVTSLATDRGNTAFVGIDGGGLLEAGALLLVGAGWQEIDDDPDSEFVTFDGGRAELIFTDGGAVTAGLTIVGGSSGLDGDGVLDGDLEVLGGLSSAGFSGIGRLEVTGDVLVESPVVVLPDGRFARQDAVIEFTVAEVADAPGNADFLQVGGSAVIDFESAGVVVNLQDASVAPGDRVQVVGVDGALTAGIAALDAGGVDFRLVPEGQAIFLEAVDLSGADSLAGTDANDSLRGGSGDDTIDGGGADDRIAGGPGSDMLEGGPGLDVASYEDAPGPVFLDLQNATQDDGQGGTDTLSGFEGLVGGFFDDDVFGDAGDNRLLGGPGNDFIQGRGGADLIDGQDGFDNVLYFDSPAPVDVDLDGTEQFGGDAEGDRIVSVSGLQGSDFDDTLKGSAAEGNFLFGGQGADDLTGRGEFNNFAGNFGEFDGDVIRDFDFSDVISVFGVAPAALGLFVQEVGGNTELTLTTGAEIARLTLDGTFEGFRVQNDAGTNSVIEVLRLTGDGDDNRLRGGAGDETLEGFSGNDEFDGGGGADLLDGGSEYDAAVYFRSPAAVDVDLEQDAGFGGDAEGDRFVSIEGLAGSEFDDRLAGDDGANGLGGGPGADILTGRDGPDSFFDNLFAWDGDRITDLATEDEIQVFNSAQDLTLDAREVGDQTVLELTEPGGFTATITLDGSFESFDLADDGGGGTRIDARRTPERQDGIIRGTDRDDAILIAQNATYLGRGGDDTYVIGAAAVDDGTSVIEDAAGSLVQVIEGLELLGFILTPEALQFDLANGARIQMLGADTFVYETGGNEATGQTGLFWTYDEFAVNIFGVEVPEVGEEPVFGGSGVFGADTYFYDDDSLV